MRALILAAGKGTRMRSEIPKVLHAAFDRPILDYVLETLGQLKIQRPGVVIGSGADQVRKFLGKRAGIFYQRTQNGTGHAVMMARSSLSSYGGNVLIWPGDMPLVKTETLKRFIGEHQRSGAVASALSSLQVNPAGYGRILRAGGRFFAIREELDASEVERRIQEVNTGIYLFRAKSLFWALNRLRPENKKGELYLTDTIEELHRRGERLEAYPFASSEEGIGINSRKDLAVVIERIRKREISRHQSNGVTFMAPDQTFVAPGAKIGRDTTVLPWCYIEAGVKIGKACEIGPFAKIRKGTVIGDNAVIGSFVEVARSKIGNKVMAKHLSYIGDAIVGAESNIGAGTITANFDGKRKHGTRLGRKVRVGSNTVFVAPVSVGDRACTGAGAVVTGGSRIGKNELVVGMPARPVKKRNVRKKTKNK